MTTSITEPTVHQWTRAEYDRLVRLGAFEGVRLELIEGELIDMPPMHSWHMVGIDLTADTLRAAFGPGHYVRTQGPFIAGDGSEPEPDVAVVPGTVRDYTDHHPDHALLLVEVAETSLAYDLTVKASLYAKAGVADYWAVNLLDRQLHVHRDPIPDPAARYGWRYQHVTIVPATGTVTPLALPHAAIAVADLLP